MRVPGGGAGEGAVLEAGLPLSAIEYKMLGTGMAVAILIDATVVRGVLLPAAMLLLGDRAWRLRLRPRLQGQSGRSLRRT